MAEHISTQNDFIFRAFRKLDNVLPVTFLELPYAFNTISKILEDGSGEGIELDYKLKKLTCSQKHKYSFDRIQRFSDKYGLDFLMNNFFKKVENKQLIIS
jgi:S-formylglutathione hydrolase FrmB